MITQHLDINPILFKASGSMFYTFPD